MTSLDLRQNAKATETPKRGASIRNTHPYIPLYVDDYEAATAHLTPEEDGVYNRLLRLSWRTQGCSLPNDPAWIARKIRLSADDFERVCRPILGEFFELWRRRWYSPALQRWIAREADKGKRDRRGVEAAVRAFILERDGYRCTYCGDSEGPFHVDHILPVAAGGGDEFENLTCACAPCNLSKGAKLLSDWRAS